jgi:hypothetical protein
MISHVVEHGSEDGCAILSVGNESGIGDCFRAKSNSYPYVTRQTKPIQDSV